ncbi:hypothetical protein [Arcobacter arenosus]|uniref:hypothetical protein n=1 Tax=Arcobacter arenosus TaxID=2576037 RepID=UPI003BAB9368
MDLNYIVDDNGNKTHVIVKIDDWNMLKENSNDNNIKNIGQLSTEKRIVLVMDSSNLFLQMYRGFDLEDWQQHFKSVFKFMNYLEAKDFGLLYLLRSDKFQYIMKKDNLLEVSQEVYENYRIRTLDDKLLDDKSVKKLKKILLENDTSENLIKEFNSSYKIGDKVSIKFRKDAEIKRLFVYDSLRIIPKFFKTIVAMINPEEEKEIEKVFSDTAHAEQLLSHYLYNSKNLTQVQRALKEADERINGDLWEKYLLIQ